MKKSLLITLAFACLIIIPQNVFAGTLSDGCSIATCPAGQDYYKQGGTGGCYIEINSLTGTIPSCESVFGAPASGKKWSFNCNDGCKQINIPTTYACPQHNADIGSITPCCAEGEVIQFNTTTSEWECGYSLDSVVELMARVFYTASIVDAVSFIANIDILINQFNNDEGPISMLLSYSGTDYEYKYADATDIGQQVLLEADYADDAENAVNAQYADEAELAQTLNWENYPEWTSLFENLSSVTFCTTDLDCGTGTCDNGICRGTAALGAFCDETTFCQFGLICDANVCVTDTGMINPEDITPGAEDQVLTTIETATPGEFVSSWEDAAVGGGGIGEFVGISADSDGSAGGYSGANALCDLAVTGSHVCTVDEMANTIRNNPTAFDLYVGEQVWINNGPPGHSDTLSNDCKGWIFDSSYESGYGRYGSVLNIHATETQFLIQFCNQLIPFACCQ